MYDGSTTMMFLMPDADVSQKNGRLTSRPQPHPELRSGAAHSYFEGKHFLTMFCNMPAVFWPIITEGRSSRRISFHFPSITCSSSFCSRFNLCCSAFNCFILRIWVIVQQPSFPPAHTGSPLPYLINAPFSRRRNRSSSPFS